MESNEVVFQELNKQLERAETLIRKYPGWNSDDCTISVEEGNFYYSRNHGFTIEGLEIQEPISSLNTAERLKYIRLIPKLIRLARKLTTSLQEEIQETTAKLETELNSIESSQQNGKLK